MNVDTQEQLRREAEIAGREFVTPGACKVLFQKSLEAVRLAGRQGFLGTPILVNVGNPIRVYPLKRCFKYWGVMDSRALARMRNTSFAFRLDKYPLGPDPQDYFENAPVSILHTAPVIQVLSETD